MKKILLFTVYILSLNNYSQSNWNLVARNPYEGFRFYDGANGFTAILDSTNNKLITYHSSAFSGLIVRLKTDLNSSSLPIESQELNWINPYSPTRGGGFDISKSIHDNELYLYGIGTIKDPCYNYEGVTIFRKKLNPTNNTYWNDANSPIIRKTILSNQFNSRQNNGVADEYGNYFFCNNGNDKKLYKLNMTNNDLLPINLNISDNYILEFKKINDGQNTHIIGMELNKEYFIYIRSNSQGYTCARYKIKDIVNSDNSCKIKSHTTFDIGINNQKAELLFFTEDNKLYSVNITENIGFSINGKGILLADSINCTNDNCEQYIRGLIYTENGKCLLIPYNYDTFYYNGTEIVEIGDNAYGILTDKIYTLNNTTNTKTFLTRRHKDSLDTDFKKIQLFRINQSNDTLIQMFQPELNNYLSSTEFEYGGGPRIRSMAIINNHLVFDGFDRMVYKNLDNDELFTYYKYNAMNPSVIEPLNDNEFLSGLYYGPFVQRFKIENNEIVEMDTHKIIDNFKKITSFAYDGENVYIGLYHNNQSPQNISRIYKYNKSIYNSDNNDSISTPVFTIPNTNHVVSMKTVEYINNDKYLFGLAENHSEKTYKFFSQHLSNPDESTSIIDFTLSNNESLRDMEIITSVDNHKNLYFITSNNSMGHLYKIDVTNPNINFTSSNIILLRTFEDNIPMNLISFLDKHLLLSFRCKQIGYITQDSNSYILQFDDAPLPTDYTEDVFIANSIDKYLYIGTRDAVGGDFNNNEGGVFKIKLPEYMGFSFQNRYHWGNHPNQILSGDFNNDGYDDIVSVTKTGDNYWAGYIWNIKINQNGDSFGNTNTFNFGAANSDFIFSGDFNNDGYDDIGLNRASDPSSVDLGEWIIRLNDQQGNFNSQIRYSWGIQPDKITIGDFNGDGYSDLAIFKNNDGWYIKLNNTNNSFSEDVIKYDWNSNPDFVFSGDFNGDGYSDLGMKNNNSQQGQWIIRFNDKSASFIHQKRYKWTTTPDFVTTGDYNNDGLSDLCVNLHSTPQSMNLGEWVFRYNYGYYFDNTFTDFLIKNKDTSNSHSLLIFPNPTSNLINFKSNRPFKFEIFNQFGTLLLKSNNEKINFEIDFKNYKKGIYIVKIKFQNNQITRRIIKI